MAKNSIPRTAIVAGFTLGASGIAKLNAVEGVKQSASSRAMFKQFDRDGLSSAERRKAIVSKHKPKG